MEPRTNIGSRIAGLGHYLPSTILSTEEATARLTVDSEWVIARTGIRNRRIADKGETVADMATAAGQQAIADVNRNFVGGGLPANVDLVIVATSTPESTMPSVAPQVAARLSLTNAAAFDVNSACAGFCYALATADAIVGNRTARGALVIGADKSSDLLDWEDRDTAILFGDGSGAAVVLPSDYSAIGPVLWGSVGTSAHLIRINPDTGLIYQDGGPVYRWATGLGHLARGICEQTGVSADELAGFIPHQANLRIVKALAKDVAGPELTVATDVIDTGNTIAATIPIALSRMSARGDLDKGGHVLLFGFGAGLSYAGQIVSFPAAYSGNDGTAA